MECHGLSLESLSPVWLHRDALLSVGESLLEFLQVVVRGRPVSVDGVIFWVFYNSLSVVFDSLFVVLGLEHLVS